MLAELRPVLDQLGECELVLIDDGSSDGTGPALEKAANEWAAVRVFRFAQNQGQGPALFFGIQRARGDVIALLDGDGQNDPADLPALIAALDEADFVTASAPAEKIRRSGAGFRA